ncbi:MAG: hypothetical protein HC901_01310 [Bdellovibrionaceae bacterium]|nr:hypothetical protein [Pseudobdellovibrionaceae bacterium]
MKVIADQKRRVVLPKPIEPGDVLEIVGRGEYLTLIRLQRPAVARPPVAAVPLDSVRMAGVDWDAPAFSGGDGEGIA